MTINVKDNVFPNRTPFQFTAKGILNPFGTDPDIFAFFRDQLSSETIRQLDASLRGKIWVGKHGRATWLAGEK